MSVKRASTWALCAICAQAKLERIAHGGLSKGENLGFPYGGCRSGPVAIGHRIAREDPLGLRLCLLKTSSLLS
jgi:hypothetical protein